MSAKSAMLTVTRSITLAPGPFAPGHLGELTQFIPFELVDAVLAETGRTERRLRLIPSRVALYLVLAMALFEGVSGFGVWGKLTAALGAPAPSPSEKALRDARRRIGAEPVKALFEVLAGPVAQPRTPGTCYRRWRTVAFDGCSSTKIPDTARNHVLYGRPKLAQGYAGYPTVMLMTLVETGTRALLAAVFGPTSIGEIDWARKLLCHLDAGMLVLGDRGFDADEFLAEIAKSGAQFLVRATSRRRPPVLAHLPDHSYLTLVNGLRLRVIEAEITLTDTDGNTLTSRYRLLTTLLDPRLDPAPALIALYHERWEIETAYLALRHTLLDQRVLRSKDPAGIAQEIWAILTLYQALRTLMCDAAEHAPGTDPDRMSFALALEHARTHTVLAHLGDPLDRPTAIGRALLASPNPPPRPRYSQRAVKSTATARYSTKDPTRPPTSTSITAITTTIHPPTTPPIPQPPTPTTTTSHKHAILDLLRENPDRPLRIGEIAAALGISGRLHTNRLGVRLSTWHRQGHLTKTAPGTYTTNKNPPLTNPHKP